MKTTDRGWAGHFCDAGRCLYHRNTLIESCKKKVIVSTVGNYRVDGEITEIGAGRYYETLVFEAVKGNCIYIDADVSKQIEFNSNWQIKTVLSNVDNIADAMHNKVVDEMKSLLK